MIGRSTWEEVLSDYLELRVEYTRRDVEVKLPKSRALAIVGPRRAGKTFFLFQLWDELDPERRRSLYVNFEDPRLVGATAEDLMEMLRSYYSLMSVPKGEKLLFLLDEVQVVEGWERFVRYVLDMGHKVILTGSSSKLLSKEIATVLRGRAITLNLYPFSLSEVLRVRGLEKALLGLETRGKLLGVVQECLEWGSYPEVVFQPELRREILREILDVTIYRDIVERWRVDNLKALRFLFKLLASSSHTSVTKLHSTMKSIGIAVGKPTLANYVEYLSDALVAFPLRAYVKSEKKKELLGFKPYFVDNGLLTVLGVSDRGRLLENLVFTELLKRGLRPNEDLFFYVTGSGREVDFIIPGEELIQVSWKLHPENRERELAALIEAASETGIREPTMVTWEKGKEEKIKLGGRVIKLLPVEEWVKKG
ncbi:ATP-binding protein [Thermococcus pacificus]|uniref:ATPase n=1 Tax=Thermococcus pacificus TaxID=71998 RepID=A0A218P8V8_9EURY|nr:ATP-binding protein [Thermococcus pacificus]ASJ07213.1 ATPase [Thermococcus pacificus]